MTTALAIVGFLAKQFFGEGAKHLGQLFWPAVFRSRRRTLGTRGQRRYASAVNANHNSHALGFLANTKVTVSDVYVPVQHEVDGRREDVYRSIRTRTRTVVLGAAGAGKSMLLKNSMVKWAADPAAFERIPVFVELFRHDRGERNIRDLVADAFARSGLEKPERFLDRALADGVLSILCDGFDETVTDRRAEVARDLKQFAEKWPACQIIVTCRDAVYDHELRPQFDHEVRLTDFDDAAIRRFLKLWFTSKQPGRDARYEVEQMMGGLRASPSVMRLARTPLLLTMIASLHDADPGLGPVLPSSRTEFYDTAVWHLLRRDSELGRARGLATYKAGHKLMALRSIAVRAQGAMAPGTDRRAVPEAELIATITQVLARFNLEATHAGAMLDEIVDRSGLLVRVDENNLLYEFPHLTLQEYLAAMELADDPERLLALYGESPDRWREAVKLWCGGARRDCTPVVRKIFGGDGRDKLLALECLAEARQIDARLADEVLGHFEPPPDDDPLVPAALGAVAADPGPRGKALLGRLMGAARQRRAFAIHALAASRLRSAVETLSDLAVWVPAARTALRATGELAIPVLAERAAAGSLDAIDDIAAVGTASAGSALAELLWDESDVAVRAAWRLAALVNSPDVEDELAHVEVGNPPGERYDWVWAPFDPGGRGNLTKVMGRIGYLIDDRVAARMPADIGRVDPRLAMPIGVRGASRQYDYTALAGLDLEIVRAARSLGLPVGDRWGNGEALQEIHKRDPAESRRLAQALFTRAGVGRGYRNLLDTLPTAVLVELATRLCAAGFDAGENQWQTSGEDLRNPFVLEPVANAALAVLLGFPYLVGAVRATGTAFGWWPWGAAWFGWGTLVMVAGFLLGFLLVWILESAGRDILFSFLPTIACLILSLPGVVTLSVVTLAEWIGWPLFLSGALVMTAVTTGLFREKATRLHAITNPFRELRRLDERVVRIRSTVISRRGVGG
ncbi:NACHT domain-containing protein [Amycolatopsis sp. NPDC051102]|uniref:NACHT domain-containing protein n=1 Tax=Amycolatopsis sp. NPDC051102 TaxID=3155163 RepID=UPI003413443F